MAFAAFELRPSSNCCAATTAKHRDLADVGATKSNSWTSAISCKTHFEDALPLILRVRAASKKKEQLISKRKRVPEQVKIKPEALVGSQQLDSSVSTTQGKTDNSQWQGTDTLEESGSSTSLPMVDRGSILNASILTAAGIGGAGVLLRQVTHWAANTGFSPVADCTVVMPFSVVQSQVGVIASTVLGVSSLRLLLLRVWPEFRQSSSLSNQQILGPLMPLDYMIISVNAGISEELLFRGALLPLVGVDWKGVLVAGLVFGALHRTGGRNTAHAVWASIVGIMYGLVAVYSQSLAPPIAVHSVANLVSAAIWRLDKD